MGTFQTMSALVLLIFLLSVVVQAFQEVAKAVFSTKASVMDQTIEESLRVTISRCRKLRMPYLLGDST